MDSQPVRPCSRRFHADPFFYAALLLAGVGSLLPCDSAPPLWRILLLAFVEEAVFRGGVQAWLEERWPRANRQGQAQAEAPGGGRYRLDRRLGPISMANVLASALFALAHLINHAPLWALGTFFPSLVFGALYTRYRRILPCAIAHALYNLVYFGPALWG